MHHSLLHRYLNGRTYVNARRRAGNHKRRFFDVTPNTAPLHLERFWPPTPHGAKPYPDCGDAGTSTASFVLEPMTLAIPRGAASWKWAVIRLASLPRRRGVRHSLVTNYKSGDDEPIVSWWLVGITVGWPRSTMNVFRSQNNADLEVSRGVGNSLAC